MPKLSERRNLILNFERILKWLAIFDEEKSKYFEEILELTFLLHNSRFLHARQPRIKNRSMREMLWRWDAAGFRQEVRMKKRSFVRIVEKLELDPLFQNNSRNPQTPCWIQSMIALSILGCHGNGNSVGKIARHFGAGDGSITTFTRRFISSVINLNETEGIIKWPDRNERNEISKRFALKGMPGVVGILDGTYVVLSQRPHIDGETFWCRKSCYAFNVQLICDDKMKIRYYLLGHPGTIYDSNCFSYSNMSKKPQKYFSKGQCLIADAGYALCWYICAPYKQPAASFPINKIFNDLFSENRVPIEQVNGNVKSRFCSLREIRTQIREHKDFELHTSLSHFTQFDGRLSR